MDLMDTWPQLQTLQLMTSFILEGAPYVVNFEVKQQSEIDWNLSTCMNSRRMSIAN